MTLFTKCIDFPLCQLVDQLLVLGRIQEGDQRRCVPQLGNFGLDRLPYFQHNVCAVGVYASSRKLDPFPNRIASFLRTSFERFATVDDTGPGRFIVGVAELCIQTSATFHLHLEPFLDQCASDNRCNGYSVE